MTDERKTEIWKTLPADFKSSVRMDWMTFKGNEKVRFVMENLFNNQDLEYPLFETIPNKKLRDVAVKVYEQELLEASESKVEDMLNEEEPSDDGSSSDGGVIGDLIKRIERMEANAKALPILHSNPFQPLEDWNKYRRELVRDLAVRMTSYCGYNDDYAREIVDLADTIIKRLKEAEK